MAVKNKYEDIPDHLRATLGFSISAAAMLVLFFALIGAVAYWPKWGGTFLGLATLGLIASILSSSILTSAQRARLVLVTALASGLIGFVGLQFMILTNVSRPEGVLYASNFFILAFALMTLIGGRFAVQFIRLITIYKRSIDGATNLRSATPDEALNKGPGSAWGDTLNYIGLTILSISILRFSFLGISGTYDALALLNAIALVTLGCTFCRHLESFGFSIAGLIGVFGVGNLISGFVMLNYVGTETAVSEDVIAFRLTSGAVISAIVVVTAYLWLNHHFGPKISPLETACDATDDDGGDAEHTPEEGAGDAMSVDEHQG